MPGTRSPVQIDVHLAVRPGAEQPLQGVLASLQRQLPPRQAGVMAQATLCREAQPPTLNLALEAPDGPAAERELQRLAPTLGLLAPYTQVLQVQAWGRLGPGLHAQLQRLHPQALLHPQVPEAPG